ncbi:hypothetical protein C0991_000416 [Blastosporella zonata]|nr:hypothetical protein C0991_000416 [Blastosporella zonata]
MKLTTIAASSAVSFAALAGAASSISTSNPFLGHDYFVSPVYRPEVLRAAANLTERGQFQLAAKALKVATSGTSLQFLRFHVVFAGASAGEIIVAEGGEEKYQTFIQEVKAQLQKFPDVRVVLQLETDSIGNLVTNLAVPKCGNAAPAQKRSLAYAIANLQLPNVALYIDGAHAGWLGWDSNIGPAAILMGEILADARAINPDAVIRGVATDVSNYNGLGNQPEQGYDELVYIRNLAPLLAAQGIDAHFIVDQSRSGNQAYTRVGTDWCNNKYAGFGTRPTTATPDPLIDSIVWVKPGGESDGTSDSSAARYDPSCSSAASVIPAPEAGTWFEAYFEQLLQNANPPL